MVTENINIDVRPGGIPIVIHVTQYEAGLRQFVFTPYTSNGTQTIVAGSATLEGTKPDGYAFQQACEMADGVITYTLQEQLCAVEGRVWSRLVIRDTNGGMIGYTAIVWVVGRAGVADDAVMSDSDISALRQFLDEFGDIDAYRGALNGALAAVGGPLVAATASAMTDTTKVYVYTGSESGYTEGHWYYWSGSAWTDGGVYQSTGINTDKTLTVEDMAADAKATGDAVAELKNDLKNIDGARRLYVNASTGSDSNNGTTAQTAFATIQKAVNSIGPLKDANPGVNKDASVSLINVAGGTYAPFIVDNKSIYFESSGTITISASSGVAFTAKNNASVVFSCPVVINQSGAYNCIVLAQNAYLRFTSTLTNTNTSTAASIAMYSSKLLVNGTLSITATNTANYCVQMQYNSKMSIVGNNNSINCSGTAIWAHSGSLIAITNSLTISNATTGIHADGGIVIYRTLTNNATTKEKTTYGGRIFTNQQTGLDSKDLIASGTDLNTVTTPGMYRLRGTYTNAPNYSSTRYGSTIVASFMVINPNPSGTGESIIQLMMVGAPFAIYYRFYTSASWYRWNSFGGNAFDYLVDGTNLSAVKDTGIYTVDPTNYSYTNYPFGTTVKSVLVVMRGMQDTDSVVQVLYPISHSISPVFRNSVYGNDTWVPLGANNDTSIFVGEYSHKNYDSLNYNPQTAIKLRVGTINIGHFNYGDSSTFGIRTAEYDMKLHGWRNYFCKQQFDIVNFNEYVPYIDVLAKANVLNGTKLTTEYVLKPQFSYFDGTMDTADKAAVIASKYPISNATEHALTGTTNNGYCRHYNVTIDENHVIGVYAIQMVFLSAPGDTYDSAASIANRKAQLDSLATLISAFNDNYVIVMGDFNTGTNTDHTNVLNFCTANSLVPCNGGFLDWMRTYEASALCLDNILVSNNILVNDFIVHNDWYGSLSTDHYGLSAEITLT